MPEELERATLAECEAVIERGLQTFYTVGLALMKIRDEELFRLADCRSFPQYCRERWGKTSGYAYDLIQAAQTFENLSTRVDRLPEFEKQIRPLARLEPEQQREAWNIAVEQSKTGKPTYSQVEDVVRTQFEQRPTRAEEESERRAREAEDRAEQLIRERQEAERQRHEAELQRREAEQRTEALLRERDEIQINRYMRFRKMIEAVQYVAEFHMESVSDTWDGITNARGGEDFMENLDKAQRCLTRLRTEHPNAVRKPGIVLKRPG